MLLEEPPPLPNHQGVGPISAQKPHYLSTQTSRVQGLCNLDIVHRSARGLSSVTKCLSMSSPFQPSTSQPGCGTIDLVLLPPATPVLRTLSYQYPLKLISPSPTSVSVPEHSNGTLEPSNPAKPAADGSAVSSKPSQPHKEHLVHTVFLLTYGGGLVAGDSINLTINLAASTRLVLLTQGSTKIFNTKEPSLLSTQHMTVNLHGDCGLVYLPDPVQPFAKSAFEQTQLYRVHSKRSSLCALDWVSEGRRARGEVWSFWRWGSRNEVWTVPKKREDANGRLLLRDNVFLKGEETKEHPDYSGRVDGLGVFGTLILYGPLFEVLGRWFVDEFKRMPRIGERKWGDEGEDVVDDMERWRRRRQKQEKDDGVLWTASSVRGFVLVKVGAKEVEGVKTWLNAMLRQEGSIVTDFGERALLCLR